MGVCFPPAHGVAGADFVSYALAMEQVAERRLRSGERHLRQPLAAYACGILPEATARRSRRMPGWRSSRAAEVRSSLIPLTEPHTGSDAAAIRTRARRRADGGWVIEGSKSFVTAGSTADLAMIVPRDDSILRPESAASPASAVLRPRTRSATEWSGRNAKLGHRTNDICRIRRSQCAGGDGRGRARGARRGARNRRSVVSRAGRTAATVQAVGMARAALESARLTTRASDKRFRTSPRHRAPVPSRSGSRRWLPRSTIACQMYLHAAALRSGRVELDPRGCPWSKTLRVGEAAGSA